MFKQEAIEALPIIDATLKSLLSWAPTRGREGADLRASINQLRVSAIFLLHSDSIGPPLAECFESAVSIGISLVEMERVRMVAAATAPISVGAIMIRNSLIQLSLVSQANILAITDFDSRQDVESTRAMFNTSFNSIEEDIADQMDATTYRAIVELHAAISFYLVETARPLPRMLRYRFNQPLSTLTMAHRLYSDAGRADELRKENKIVHPAFCPLVGLALSN
jgi:hypothetical protein